MQIINIAGNVTSTKELRKVGENDVFSFSVAINNGKNKDGSWKDSTFYQCDIWGARASKVAGFLTKGTKIAVTGRPSFRAHDGKAYASIFVNDFTLLGGGEQAQPQDQQRGGYDESEGDSIPF